jgi:methyl-accepting chemotaxis protein
MKLTLGKKLGLGFGVILALMILSAVLTYVKASSIKETEERAMTVRAPTIAALKDLQRDLNQTQSKGRQVVLAGAEPARREAAQKLFNDNWGAIEKDVASLDELTTKWSLQSNRDRLAETKERLPALRQAQEVAMKHAMGSDRDAVTKAGDEFADQATPATEAIKRPLDEVADSNDKLMQQEAEEITAKTHSMYLTMAISTFAALGIGTSVAIFLSRTIAGATQSVLVQAEAIAAGDLTRDDLQVRSQDELGDLTTAINKMSASLKRMILAITENAVQVASASEELNSTSQQITANSEETSAQADVVSRAAQAVSQNLQTVRHRRRADGGKH